MSLFQVRVKNFNFAPRLLPTVVTIFFISLFITLGFWQLHRAQQKQILVKQFQQTAIKPWKLTEIKDTTPDYIQVEATGHFDNQHTFLLDNKWHQRQIGYQVLTPFINDRGQPNVLVNRGWIPRGEHYPKPPAVTPAKEQHITGKLYLPKRNFLLGKAVAESSVWPKITQGLAIRDIEAQLPYKIYPFVILLAVDAPDGFIRDWQPVISSPHKNIGYAVQWFSFAAVLLLIFLLLNTKRIKETK